jgi:hypothetical protein
MRPIKTSLATAAICCALLASGPLSAAPIVSGWDVSPTETGSQQVRIHWSEPGTVEMTTFPAARQVILTLPGALLTSDSLTAPTLDDGSLVKRARFQPVTMADGSEAVTVTLTLDQWQELEPVAGARWLVLRPSGANDAADAPLKITRETLDEAPGARVELSSFGSVTAPATGAGQGNVAAPQFWVPPAVEDPAASAPGADQGMLATLTTLDRRIDLTDFQGAPLEDVIRTIAKQLNLNILMDPGSLPGTVTMELYNVKLSEALDALLKLKGRGYVIEPGGIVRIVDRKSLRSDEEDITIQVAAIPINWINVDDLEEVLEPFTSGRSGGGGGGSTRGIVVSEHSNTLVIRDTPEKVSEIQNIIRQLDVPVKSVKMEVRLVDMTERAARNSSRTSTLRVTTEVSRIRLGQLPEIRATWVPETVC